MMHVAIIGSGAIGSSLGALLARSGQEVTLIGRPEQVAALHHAGGIEVGGALGAFTVPLASAVRLTFRPDLVLLAVKTQDVATAVQDNLDVILTVAAAANLGARSRRSRSRPAWKSGVPDANAKRHRRC